MNILRWSATALVIGLFTVLSSGCVVPDGGYGYGGGVAVGVDYYEPYGANYGGWGPGYQVGPFRGGGHPAGHGGSHAYRSAPASHPMPSIPSHSAPSRSGRSRSDDSRSR